MLLAAVDFDNLHQVLRVLYDEMMPLCSNMTGVAKGIAGLGALFYVAAKVWQALDGLGISNVSILKVSHSKIDEYKEQVRVEAMQNAKQSAQTLAGAIGQNVGKCFYIYDSNNNVMPVLYDNMAVMRSAKAGYGEEAAADEPLDFKTIKLQYNVQAKFVLE